jgi:carbon-monoxide dehydrogenase large subunit
VAGSILGNAVRRREDPRLVTGTGRFASDVAVPGLLHAAFVRSPLPHARVQGVDIETAAAMSGVVAVLTAADLDLAPVQEVFLYPAEFSRPPLARDVVRFTGEPVAVVLAETQPAAVDAALMVGVDYDPLPAVADAVRGARPDAPRLFEGTESNVAFEINSAGDDVLAGADVTVRCRFVNQRVAPFPLEGSAIVVIPEDDGRLTAWLSLQGAFGGRDAIAMALGLEDEQVRAISPDVGGGFGAKINPCPEYLVVAAAARHVGRPVRWVDSRSENLVAMWHGRGQVQEVELGARDDGTLVGLRARVTCDAGAYPSLGAFLPMYTSQMSPGVYRLEQVDFGARSVVTNTTPTSAYRGAGRPEATALIERAMDLLAVRLGVDPAELRRRNLIPSDAFPYTTPTGSTYDSGDYEAALDRALEVSGYAELRQRQAELRASGAGRQLGIGLSCYVEVTGAGSSSEHGMVEIQDDGSAVVAAGTGPTGQGHETALAQVAAQRLGLPIEQVSVRWSDTDLLPRGSGTAGSRSLQHGGPAVDQAAAGVLDQAKALAAEILEAARDDIVQFEDGRFGVAGTPTRALAWADLAAASEREGGDVQLRASADFDQSDYTYPFGCHVAVVEVDTETGEVRLLRHVAVDDCGIIINPLLAEGQVHGGIAQGIAQALYEEVLYDADGNPRSTSLLDYSFPTANEFPDFETAQTVTPTNLNPLGAKGIGESGTIGSTPAVWNAVCDALAPLGVENLDLPLSPDRVWAALAAARQGR